MEAIEVKPSSELAYLVGVMQGDGCLYSYKDRTRKDSTRTILMLGAKDIEMVQKARDIFVALFKREVKICKKSTGIFDFHTSVKTLLTQFEELDIEFKDPPKPPFWVKHDIKLFGPYLAGLIDADGSISIKRPKYPQCRVRIISGHSQSELEKSIERILGCHASIYKSTTYVKVWDKWTSAFDLDFVLSPKIIPTFSEYILPYIQIPRKRDKVIKYLTQTSN